MYEKIIVAISSVHTHLLNGETMRVVDVEHPSNSEAQKEVWNDYGVQAIVFNEEKWKELQQQLRKADSSLDASYLLEVEGMTGAPEEWNVPVQGKALAVEDLTYLPKRKKKRRLLALHQEQDGKCSGCEQRCDASVMSLSVQGGRDVILCPDCTVSEAPPTFQAAPSLVEEIAQNKNMPKEEAKRMLEAFPRTYVLVAASKKRRLYWTWDDDAPVRYVAAFRDGWIDKAMTKRAGNWHKSAVKERANAKEKRKVKPRIDRAGEYKEVSIADIHPPVAFLESVPKAYKIDDAVAHYQAKGVFRDVIVVQEIEDGYELTDGYTRYLAAKQLGLSSLRVVVQKKITVQQADGRKKTMDVAEMMNA